MLAVFDKSIGNPPEELGQPASGMATPLGKQAVLEEFSRRWPETTCYRFSAAAGGDSCMAFTHARESTLHPRSVVCMEEVHCVFNGSITNIGDLRRHYGLSRHASEAMLVIELYRVLRDRAPYPPDQAVKDLDGSFAFVLFDSKNGVLFVARDRDGAVDIQWGVAGADGSLVISDDPEFVKDVCGMASCSFPAGCLFMNRTWGLVSFVQPMYRVRGYIRKDDSGAVCSVFFQVDVYSRIPSIPRVGSAETWGATAAVGEV